MATKKPQAKKQEEEQDDDYDNTNTGALFVNKRKKKKNHPDMQGSFTDKDGNEYWLSAWSKTHKKAGKYLSISATLKDEVEHEDESNDEDDSKNGDKMPWE